jgi:HlyD family secretion protein
MRKGWIIILTGLLIISCQKPADYYQGYIEGYFTNLSSNSDGFLQQLIVHRGDAVKAGQELFALEGQPQLSQFEQAREKLIQAQADLTNLIKGQRSTVLEGIQAQLRQAQADLEYAQRTYQRYQALVRTGAISKSQFDQAKSDFERSHARINEIVANLGEAQLGARTDVIKSARAAVSGAAAELNSAEWFLSKKTIEAPADATVFDTFYRNNEYVPAGRPVVSLLIPTDIRVIFFVPQMDLNKIKYGMKVIVRCDGCARTYSGNVTFISSKAEFTPPIIYSEEERQKFVFRIEARLIPDDAKLVHPGQPVDVRIQN